ncbi:MAG: RNA methyltransferase [Planctomycetia bacterium]|nr:RNA methyltransferase [Planctomycetia bacterium]
MPARLPAPPNGPPVPFFSPCGPGFEPVLAQELRDLGASNVEERRAGVAYEGDASVGRRACLWLRTAIRVQELIWKGPARGPRELYSGVAEVNWPDLLDPGTTIAVDASIRDSEITHSGFAALTVKDAVVDAVRDAYGERPNVDTESPDLPLKLVLRRDEALLYRDWSGASLHKRGWRPIQVKSPLNEATAAAILMMSGWDRRSPLADPMCGSGTFPIEAALWAADRAPGLERTFAFERWRDHHERFWALEKAEARKKAKRTLPFRIMGADRHEGAVRLARKGAADAGVSALIDFDTADAKEWRPRVAPAIVFANPPYGERLGEGEDLVESWKALGNFLHRCGGASAFVLSGNAELTKFLGLRAAKKWVVMNGPIECRLLKYEVRAREGPRG